MGNVSRRGWEGEEGHVNVSMHPCLSLSNTGTLGRAACTDQTTQLQGEGKNRRGKEEKKKKASFITQGKLTAHTVTQQVFEYKNIL